MSNALETAFDLAEATAVGPGGQVTEQMSIGGQQVDLPTPVTASPAVAQDISLAHDIATALHPYVQGGHVTPQAGILALALGLTRGWIRF
jgi:hypothetical protein